jgi:VIT1/CCC1 family predicted Fe2+/Mn2+ transporter|tara:strand:- start:3995 stop:4471 length:477 start_codon:yes stop_codon:yes gene_type:complete
MNHSTKTGFSFGITTAVITTLGLMVGLNSGTNSQLAVIGGILTIAIADAFSDALGIHISEESEGKHTVKEIWQSTGATFLTKMVFGLTFLVPVLFLQLSTAVIVSIAWGMLIIGVFSYYLAKQQKINAWRVILEHLLIMSAVIAITHYLGIWIKTMFA